MDIFTIRVLSRIQIFALFLISFALCFISGHSRIALAQEGRARPEVRSDRGDDIIIIDEDAPEVIGVPEIIYIDDSLGKPDVEAKVTELSQDAEEEAPRGKQMRSPEDEQSGDKFPPEVRKMMEEEGISPEELMGNPELREKFREKVEKRMKEERREDSQPGAEPGKENKEARKKAGSAKEGLELYTSAIVKKNLFRQLGSGDEKKGPSYALTAVISDDPGNSDEPSNKAIIERQGGGESYYVSEGDTFAGKIEVLDIEDEKVKLDDSGEEITLTLGAGAGGGGGGRGGRGGGGRQRGGGGPDGGENSNNNQRGQRGGGNFNADNIPPFARRMLEERGISIEQLRSDPGLQQELRREFQQRARNGGGRQRRIEQIP